MEENSFHFNNSRNKNKIMLSIVLLLLISLSLIYTLHLKSYKSPNLKTQTSEFQDKSSNKKLLNGHIIFQNGNKIINLDPRNDKKSVIIEFSSSLPGIGWVYQNGYLFIKEQDRILKINIKDSTAESLKLELSSEPSYIYPSPDGNKVAFVISPGYPGAGSPTLYLANFENKKILSLAENDFGFSPKWFSDSQHLLFTDSRNKEQYSQDLITTIYIYDTSSSQKKILETGNIPPDSIAVSRSGLQVLWMDNKTNTQIGPFGETYHPDMVFRSISSLFPETKIVDKENYYKYNSNLDNTSARTPFTKFPIIARDYRGVKKIIPGSIYSHFFLEVESGKPEIYFTDSVPWGTFKKINPNNVYSYYLLDYSPLTKKVLALKYRFIKDINYTSESDVSLVILDEGNYAETIAGIDRANFYEKEILRLDKSVTPGYYSRDAVGMFSPDGKFVLAPLLSDSAGPSQYKIVSVDGSKQFEVSEKFGIRVYWTE